MNWWPKSRTEGRQADDIPYGQGHPDPNADTETETTLNEETQPTICEKKDSQLTFPVVAKGKVDYNTTPAKKPKISPDSVLTSPFG